MKDELPMVPLFPKGEMKQYGQVPLNPESFKQAPSIEDEFLRTCVRQICETEAKWESMGVRNIRLEPMGDPWAFDKPYGLRLVGDAPVAPSQDENMIPRTLSPNAPHPGKQRADSCT